MDRQMRGFVFLTWIAVSVLGASPSHGQAVVGEDKQPKSSAESKCNDTSAAKSNLPADCDLSSMKRKVKDRRSKRVWSNDDFAPAATPAVLPQTETAAKPAIKPTAPPNAPAAENAESQKAREAVEGEMLATAKVRQKAYDDTINEVKGKLLVETNPMRIEIYNNILRDTEAMKEVNNRVVEQFGKKPDASTEQPAKAETENSKAPEEVKK